MTQYIDPNSGAAPQPGGWAGPDGMERGHALASDIPEGVEQTRQLNEADDLPEPKTVSEIAEEAEKNADKPTDEQKARQERVDAMANPQKYFAEDPNTGAEAPEFTEAEMADAQALEHEAVNVNEEEGDTEDDKSEEKPAAKKTAKKTAAKKS